MGDFISQNLLVWLSVMFVVVAAFAWLAAAVTVLRDALILRYAAVCAASACAVVAANVTLTAAGSAPPNFVAIVACAAACMALAPLVICLKAAVDGKRADEFTVHTSKSKVHAALARH